MGRRRAAEGGWGRGGMSAAEEVALRRSYVEVSKKYGKLVVAARKAGFSGDEAHLRFLKQVEHVAHDGGRYSVRMKERDVVSAEEDADEDIDENVGDDVFE